MKLTLAVGILSAQSSTLAVASEKKKFLHHSSNTGKPFSLQNALGDDRMLLNRPGTGDSIGKKERTAPLRSTLSSTTSWISSRRALEEEDGKMVECTDPDGATAETRAAADVGVLEECATGEICVANASSSLGGFCYAYDTIYSRVCDPTSSYFNSDCDCSAFDVQTKTGTFSCLSHNMSMGYRFNGCSDVSAHTSLWNSLNDNMYTSRGMCTEFFVGEDAASNSTTKLCTTFGIVDGSRNGLKDSSCELQIDGQVCASCTYTVDFSQGFTGSVTRSMVLESKADCSNVVDGLMIADLWEIRDLPIIQNCYKTFCDMCPQVKYINRTDTTAISVVDGFGPNLTCEGLFDASFEHQITVGKCPEATAVAQAECCMNFRAPSSASASAFSFALAAGMLLTVTSVLFAMT